MTHHREQLGAITADVEEAIRSLTWQEAARRLWARDHTLWGEDQREVGDRLGWLTEPQAMTGARPGLKAFAAEVLADGLAHTVWCGMGGSSLFAELLARTAGAADRFRVLDTSHPAVVGRVLAGDRTLRCFASKSGGTIETRTQLDFAWARDPRPDRFVAVTDAGSGLDALAAERSFRSTFHANPEIGGRFSALSHFGLVPAALLGFDLAALVDSAQGMAARCAPGESPATNPGIRLGAVMAAAAAAGRDKLTLLAPAEWPGFGAWVEQLVAESTGKHGRGIVPVVDEPLGPPEVYGPDRLFVSYQDHAALDAIAAAGHPVVRLGPVGADELGAEVFRFEVAVALAGALLGVNPFDQPDVEAAKRAAAATLEGDGPPVVEESAAPLLGTVAPGDYVAVQAFLDPADPCIAALENVRRSLRDRYRVAVTIGLGPRYLHSTGQLHKGGPPTGVFLQVVDPAVAGDDLPIPGRRHGFGALLRAQADGDYRALRDRGRRVARVPIDDLISLGA